MKGGKGGRKRKDTSGGAAREATPRGKPKKGSRKNPGFGGMPSTGDE